jgi:predicted tellurium resistance membrane protein TerC
MAEYFTVEALTALVTLTALEIVLGVDNIIFIAIVAAKLPPEQRRRARNIGLALAAVQRILLLLAIGWVIGLKANLVAFGPFDLGVFSIPRLGLSGRDLILLAGGLFLIAKATKEIHEKVEGDPEHLIASGKKAVSYAAVITNIVLLDAVFSVDSILTAIGLSKQVPIMIAAVVISIIVMMIFAGAIAGFIERHPTIKVLALAILVTIGVMLVGEAFGARLPRGYLYFAMTFSLVVELLNIRASKKRARSAREDSGV